MSPPAPRPQPLPLDVQRRVDEACDRFEAAWKAGQRPSMEAFLSGRPEAERAVLLYELIALEAAYRRLGGEAPDAAEYEARFPGTDRQRIAWEVEAAGSTARTRRPVLLAAHLLRIRCPHCHNPIQLVDDRPDEVLCPGCGSSFRVRDARATDTLSTARPLGKFHLLERVGLGAFGAVWKARDAELDRLVALKIPHAGLLASAADLERFHREARAAAQLRHPGIVTVHEVATIDGLPVLVADFIEGVPLKELLEARRLTFRESAALIAQLAEALDYAHTVGLVHRDVKPANIMIEHPGAGREADELASVGRPLIMDFGLALRGEAEITMTLDGQIIGTPAYMSPEQASGQGHAVDRRSDVYSLGVMLYELLCGELPFRGSKLMMLRQVLHEEPRSPRRLNDKIPRDLQTVCLKALAKSPAQRYASARELAADLRRFLAGEPIVARPAGVFERALKWVRRRPAAAALLAVSVLALLALVGGVVGLIYNAQLQEGNRQLDGARRSADEQKAEADLQRQRAERYLYAAHMNLAHQAWQEGKTSRMAELLREHHPAVSGKEDVRGFEWHYLWRLCHAARFTVQGSSENKARAGFGPLTFSPDGARLAFAGSDQTVRVWDAATGRELLVLKDQPDAVTALEFSPDRKHLAVATPKGAVGLWNLQTGKLALSLGREGLMPVRLAFSADGKRLAATRGGVEAGKPLPGEVTVWDIPGGREALSLRGHGGQVHFVAFHPDGSRIVTAGDDQTIKIWDAGTGKPLRTLPAGSAVRSVGLSHDGKRLAAALADGTVKVWDVAAGKEWRTFRGHTGAIHSLAFSPDGTRLASAGDDQTVKLWDAARGQEVVTLKGHTGRIHSVAFGADGDRLASAGEDGTVKVWSAAGKRLLFTLRGHEAPVRQVAFSPDGKHLASASADEVVKVWDPMLDPEPVVVRGRGHCVAFDPGGALLACGEEYWVKEAGAAGQRLRGRVKLRGAGAGEVVRTMLSQPGGLYGVAFSPDGKRVAGAGGYVGGPGEVLVSDVAGRKKLLTLPCHSDRVLSVAFSPDGRRLATGSGDKDRKVVLWDGATGKQRLALDAAGPVTGIAFSPDGKRLAWAEGGELPGEGSRGQTFAFFHAAPQEAEVRVRDAETGAVLLTLRGHRHLVDAVAFSRDGRLIATASHDRTLKLWDARTGEETATLKGHTAAVVGVAFGPDGQRLASASFDGTVKVWGTATGQETLTLKGPGGMLRVAFSGDGRRIAAASSEAVIIWDATPLHDSAER